MFGVLLKIGIMFVLGLASRAINAAIQALKATRPSPPSPFQNPLVPAGTPIPVVYGTRRVSPITTWFFGAKLAETNILQSKVAGFPVYKTIAFNFKVTCQQILGWGEVDSIANMMFGERSLADQPLSQQYDRGDGIVVTFPTLAGGGFTGPHVDSITVYGGGRSTDSMIFLPNIFGGRGRGGGFTAIGGDANEPLGGHIRFYTGSMQTGPDEVMQAKIGPANVPSYADLCFVVLDDVNVGEASVPPSIDWIFYREPRIQIPGGAGTMVVNSRLIHGLAWDWRAQECSPAAIIYDLLRNPLYGLGEPEYLIAGAGAGVSNGLSGTFEDAQRGLVNEGLGVSLVFSGDRAQAQSVIDELLRTVDAVLNRDPVTFQRKLKLIRNEAPDDASFAALRSLGDHEIQSLSPWTRTEWSETFNVVTVEYSDAATFYQKNTVTLKNDANIAMTGGERPMTVQYMAVTDRAVALKLCARDLKAVSLRLWKGQAKVTRAGWDFERGDVFKLSYSKYGVTDLQTRVMAVDLGDDVAGTITVDLVEDVFHYEDVFHPSATPTDPSSATSIIRPSIISTSQTRTAGVGSLTFTILDQQHRITEVAYRTQVADGAPSSWNVVATASANTSDLTFPFNDHVTDGDMNGDVVATVPLSGSGPSMIEVRLTYIGYATVAAPTSDMQVIDQAFTFDVSPATNTTNVLDGAANPIIWDVTGKTDDSASATISGNRSLVILGATPGFRGRILITSTGAGGYTFTLPAGSIIGDGSSLNVTLGLKDQLSVYFDGTYYWWNLDTHATTLPPVALDATLHAVATMTADLRGMESSLVVDGTPSGDLTL
jgi:hypothetical protein